MMSGQCMWRFPISRIRSVPSLWHPHRWSYPLTGPPHSFQRLRSFFEIYCTWPTLCRGLFGEKPSRPLMTLAIYFRDKNVSCVTSFCWHVLKEKSISFKLCSALLDMERLIGRVHAINWELILLLLASLLHYVLESRVLIEIPVQATATSAFLKKTF